ncbi:FAD-binding oxidoreductase [Brucella sp. H1_1004]|uniref:NAD(P)/FAD-dependent oxidoreductase n=1 Tax=Brucella sp. H1_1004 TaxID=3110109 RepID=UPI0039B3F9FC
MTQSPHVVVIGAGTLGMCTAYNLVKLGARVTVLDANAVASGSSGRSVGVIGTQFTDIFEIQLRQHSMRQFREFEAFGLNINRIGYLRLARTSEQMDLFAQSVLMQQEAGFRSRVYQADQLREVVPHISTEGLAGGIFGPDDGFIDPHELCMLLADKVKEAGSVVRQFCELEKADRLSSGYQLQTSNGVVECDIVVNAAGAWAPQVAEIFGQTLHVKPERHEAITIQLDVPLSYTMPMVMDLVNGEGTGLNFRHEKPSELIAEVHKVTSLEPENPDHYNDQCEEASKIDLAELLLERVPELPGARLGRGWAGLYPMTYDKRPFVGPLDASEPTLITAAGAGGYGIQLSPVIGQLAADWVLKGEPQSFPEALQLKPSAERNISG